LTAGIFLLLLNHFKLSFAFWYYAILSGGLIVGTFIDFEHQIIPDEITLGGLVLGLLLAVVYHNVHLDHWTRGELLWLYDVSHGFFSPGKTWLAGFKLSILDSFWGAIIGGGSIYLTGVLGSLAFRKEAMGGGDVKLMAMLGSFIGWKLVLLVFFLGAVLGLICGLITLAKDKTHVIPYGPYLSMAALIAIIWGENIIRIFFIL
jgi:leader peptidase (prepilin peptidase)/N-methyltransferase